MRIEGHDVLVIQTVDFLLVNTQTTTYMEIDYIRPVHVVIDGVDFDGVDFFIFYTH